MSFPTSPSPSALQLEHAALLGEEMICEIVNTPIPFPRLTDSLEGIVRHTVEDCEELLALEVIKRTCNLESLLDHQALIAMTSTLERLQSDPSVFPDLETSDKGLGFSLLRNAALTSAIAPIMERAAKRPVFGKQALVRQVGKFIDRYPSILRSCYETPVSVLLSLTEEMIVVRRKLERLVREQSGGWGKQLREDV